MKARIVAALGAVACLVILGGCGGQMATQTPTPSPDPSPRPTATTLTEKQVFTRYLAEFAKRNRAEEKAYHAMTPLFHQVHEHWWDLSTAQKHKAAHKALEIARQFDRLSVDYGAMTPPPYLAKSHAHMVKFLRLCCASMLHYSTYLEGGANSDSELKASDRDFVAATAAGRQWAFALRVAARRLGVKIPFKITAD